VAEEKPTDFEQLSRAVNVCRIVSFTASVTEAKANRALRLSRLITFRRDQRAVDRISAEGIGVMAVDAVQRTGKATEREAPPAGMAAQARQARNHAPLGKSLAHDILRPSPARRSAHAEQAAQVELGDPVHNQPAHRFTDRVPHVADAGGKSHGASADPDELPGQEMRPGPASAAISALAVYGMNQRHEGDHDAP
jgi:hypothetical protein